MNSFLWRVPHVLNHLYQLRKNDWVLWFAEAESHKVLCYSESITLEVLYGTS